MQSQSKLQKQLEFIDELYASIIPCFSPGTKKFDLRSGGKSTNIDDPLYGPLVKALLLELKRTADMMREQIERG